MRAFVWLVDQVKIKRSDSTIIDPATTSDIEAVRDRLPSTLEAGRLSVKTELAQPLTNGELRGTPVDVLGLVAVSNQPAQPLTDAQLRAAAVPVSGPLTDAQLRAAAVPVSGPLTDTQLRAANVPVSDAGLGTDGAAPPSIAGTGVRGWLRALYDLAVGKWDIATSALRDALVANTVDTFVADLGTTGTDIAFVSSRRILWAYVDYHSGANVTFSGTTPSNNYIKIGSKIFPLWNMPAGDQRHVFDGDVTAAITLTNTVAQAGQKLILVVGSRS